MIMIVGMDDAKGVAEKKTYNQIQSMKMESDLFTPIHIDSHED